MKTPQELKEQADRVNEAKNRKLEAEANAKATKRQIAMAKKITQCEVAMDTASKKGDYYCEVDIDRDMYEELASHFRAYNPSINGDGYRTTVICFRFGE